MVRATTTVLPTRSGRLLRPGRSPWEASRRSMRRGGGIRKGSAPKLAPDRSYRSGRLGLIALVADDFEPLSADGDLLRLHRLGHLAHEIDHQQAVGQVGVLDADE